MIKSKPEDIIELYRRIESQPPREQSYIRQRFYEFAKRTVYINMARNPDLISKSENHAEL